jgi:hypothetical protein
LGKEGKARARAKREREGSGLYDSFRFVGMRVCKQGRYVEVMVMVVSERMVWFGERAEMCCARVSFWRRKKRRRSHPPPRNAKRAPSLLPLHTQRNH